MISDLFIRSISLPGEYDKNMYPYSIPAIAALRHGLNFKARLTIFVGENGSGKSTLIEAIAAARGFNPEGGSINFSFATNESHSRLFNDIKLVKGAKRLRDGYFLRAESYYNVASNIEELDKEPSGAPSLISSYGGRSLHKQSHGESFMALVSHRLGGGGLYIFDEPESALSPARQLELMVHIKRLVESGSQIIMATHSPILMAFPGADVIELDDNGFTKVDHEDTNHFQIYKSFMHDNKLFIKRILKL